MVWPSRVNPRTGSTAHRRWRAGVLHRDQHRCQLHLTGCTQRATEADHITELADGGAELNISNGQAACANCHNRKTAAHARATQLGRRRRAAPTHPGRAR